MCISKLVMHSHQLQVAPWILYEVWLEPMKYLLGERITAYAYLASGSRLKK